MPLKYGPYKIPQKENLTVWYDMSHPDCINFDGLFSEDADRSTLAGRQQHFKDTIGSEIDMVFYSQYSGSVSGNPYSLRYSWGGDSGARLGYKDLSDGIPINLNLHCSDKINSQKVIAPLLDGQRWYFEVHGSAQNTRVGRPSTSGEGDPGIGVRENPFNNLSVGLGANNTYYTASWFSGNTKSLLSSRGFASGYSAEDWIDEFGLVGGRPGCSMYARISHSPTDYEHGVGEHPDYHTGATGLAPLQDWEVHVGYEQFANNWDDPIELKPGDVVTCGTFGDFEIGPPLLAGERNIDASRSASTDPGHYGNTVGDTYHPIRPAKHNTYFPQPKWGIDTFTSAVTPLIPNPELPYADRIIIRNELSLIDADDVHPNLDDDFELTSSSRVKFLNQDGTYGEGNDYLWVSASSKTTQATYKFRISQKGLEPLLSQLKVEPKIKQNPNDGLGRGTNTYSPDYEWDLIEFFLYDEYGHMLFWGKCGKSCEDTGPSDSEFFPNVYMDNDNPNNIPAVEFNFAYKDVVFTGSDSFFEQDIYDLGKHDMTIESNSATNYVLDKKRGHSVVIVPKRSTDPVAYPPVLYDNRVAGTPGFFTVKTLPKVFSSGNSFQVFGDLQNRFGSIDVSLYARRQDSAERVKKISFAAWIKRPGLPSYADKHCGGPAGGNDISGQPLYLLSMGNTLYFGLGQQEPNSTAASSTGSNVGIGNYGLFLYVREGSSSPYGTDYLEEYASEPIEKLQKHGEWMHVAFTYDSVGNSVDFYLNGEHYSRVPTINQFNPSGTFPELGWRDSNEDIRWYHAAGIGIEQPSYSNLYNVDDRGTNTEKDNVPSVSSLSYDRRFDGYENGNTDMSIGSYQVWRDTVLSSNDIKGLYDSLAVRFNKNLPPLQLPPPIENTPISQDVRHVPRRLDLDLQNFTSSTDIETVVSAIESTARSTNDIPVGQLGVFAVLDQDHVANDLSVYHGVLGSVFGPGTVEIDSVGFYGINWVSNPNGSTANVNDNCSWIGSYFWGDNELSSVWSGSFREMTPPMYIGMAAFSEDRYLGTTYMFFYDYFQSRRTYNSEDVRPVRTYFTSADTAAGEVPFKTQPEYYSSMSITDLFKGSYTNVSAAYGSSRISDPDDTRGETYAIHGYTHDVSGFYEVNGKPSSIDNPYIEKTTKSGLDTEQGWRFTSNSGNNSTAYYSGSGAAKRLTTNCGVWGWKPGEIVVGNNNAPTEGIWGIANWNSSSDTNSIAYWGPNKTFDSTENVKYYCFAERGLVRT